MGVVLGIVGGIFELAIEAVADFIAKEVEITVFTRYVSTAISFLLIGAAARRLAQEWRSTTPGWQVGAVIGGISELIALFGGAVILALSPVADAALHHLSAREQQLSQDPVFVGVAITAEVGSLVVFGALVGWLAAWSVTRLPPRG
jgi:ABC-type uncharacterized transport system permease subunit